MIALLDLGPSIHAAGDELIGAGHVTSYGQLITPLTSYADQGLPWALDNGCFSQFNERAFFRLLARQRPHRERCKFVVVPDVVGCWARTRALFWQYIAKLSGWPRAIVLQDGLELSGIPWGQIAAVFVGGTDEFKYSKVVRRAIEKAHQFDKWVHVGRVNTSARADYFDPLGIDSMDGSGISKYTHMRDDVRAGIGGGLFPAPSCQNKA